MQIFVKNNSWSTSYSWNIYPAHKMLAMFDDEPRTLIRKNLLETRKTTEKKDLLLGAQITGNTRIFCFQIQNLAFLDKS